MKKLLLLVLLLGVLVLSGCNNAKAKVYPNYVTQKSNIKKLYLLSDITMLKGKTVIVDKNKKLMDKVLEKAEGKFEFRGYELVGNDLLTIGGVAPEIEKTIMLKKTKKDKEPRYLAGDPGYFNENYKEMQEKIEDLYISMLTYSKTELQASEKTYIKEISEIHQKYHADKDIDAYVVAFLGIKTPSFGETFIGATAALSKTMKSYNRAKERAAATGESQRYYEYTPKLPFYVKETVFVIATDGEVLWENSFLVTEQDSIPWTASRYSGKMSKLIPNKD